MRAGTGETGSEDRKRSAGWGPGVGELRAGSAEAAPPVSSGLGLGERHPFMKSPKVLPPWQARRGGFLRPDWVTACESSSVSSHTWPPWHTPSTVSSGPDRRGSSARGHC